MRIRGRVHDMEGRKRHEGGGRQRRVLGGEKEGREWGGGEED